MSNIKGIGDKTGNWKNNVRLVKALEPITVLPKKVGTIKQVVSDFYGNITFLSHKGHVYQSSSKSYTSTLKAVQNLPPIKSIHSGYHHLFAMTKGSDPKIYGWGFNNYFQLGLPMERTYDKPTLIPYSKKIQIHEIHPSGYASLFLDTKEHILYGCGNNTHGQTAIKNSSSKVKTIKRAYKNVSKVFTGHAAHSYLIKSDGRLYAFGCNFGQFGHGYSDNKHKKGLVEIDLKFSALEIKKITCGYKHSCILTNDGRAFVCGVLTNTGMGMDIRRFIEYPQFKKNNNRIKIKDINSGFEYIAFLTQDNSIWVSGNFRDNTNSNKFRKLIQLKQSSYKSLVACDRSPIILFQKQISHLSQDLGKLLKNGYLSDCQIKNIPVHKILIEIRIGKNFDEVNKYLDGNCTLKEIKNLLKWVYCDRRINFKRTKKILNNFGIKNPKKTKTLKSDLKKLLFNEQNSDFGLLVQSYDDENEDEQGELFEEFRVHKFILAARSGLFLAMFENIDQQNIQTVTDYSGKSIDTIELLISFLYTDEIPITSDHDQEFIKEEFANVVEYYQLNPKINILDIFEKFSLK